MEVTVARFELYPKDDPTGYAVGFSVKLGNGRSFYRDTIVSLEDIANLADTEIVGLAYQTLREWIEVEVERLSMRSPILGTNLVLPEGVLEDEGVIVDEVEEPPIEEPEIGE